MNRPADDTPLAHALTLANLGLKVIPIKPGGKHPPVAAWQKTATTNPDTIRHWWTEQYPNAGLGLVLGTQPDGRHLFALDLDRHNPNADGHTSLNQLTGQYGPLPDTVTSRTGGNGTHIILQAPHPIRNNARRLGPGIDIRGEGGQIVIAPTIHPNGTPYQWAKPPWNTPIAPAPDWLIQQLTTPEPAAKPTPAPALNSPTPADLLREHWNWPQQLENAGWTHHHTDHTGDQHWTRPGKNPRDGSSAVLHHPDGPLVIFTTEIPATLANSGTPTIDGSGRSYSPLHWYAAHHHNGDLSEASHHILNQHTPQLATLINQKPSEPDHDPDRHLLEQLIDWHEFWDTDHSAEDWIIQPVIAARRSHAIYAPGGTGKSLFSLWLATRYATGQPAFGNPIPAGTVLYLDYEMTADDLAERLDAMGIDNPDHLKRLHYALLPNLPAADTPEGGHAICRLADLVNADLVILDTFGRAVTGDENDADTVRAFYRLTGSQLKRAGRAFLRIDHAGKDINKGQRGTSAKNDDVDVVWQMTRTDNGHILKAVKRRMGWVPETVDLTIDDNPLGYDTSTRPGWPAGTAECVRLLDELDVPIDVSQRQAMQILRDAGHGRKASVVRKAVLHRRETLANLVDNPVDNMVESASQTTGPNNFSNASQKSGTRRDAPPTKNTKPLHTGQKSASQKTGTRSGRGNPSTASRVRHPKGDAPGRDHPGPTTLDDIGL